VLKNTDKDKNDEVHDDFITDLLPIPEMGLIASASLDSNIILWNMRDMSH